jgi:integrase/recombinase XerD
MTLKNLEIELKLKGFSDKTLSSYLFHNQKFLDFVKKEPADITEDDIKSYLAFLISDKRQKPASINLAICTLRFFYEKVLKKDIFKNISSLKTEKKLPTVLTKDEIRQLLSAISNRKHRLLIEMMYSSGLRVSEAVSLKVEDINPAEKIGKVVSGKGRKDRMIILSRHAVRLMESYLRWREKKGIQSEYLFQSNKDHSKNLTSRQAQKIIKDIAQKAGIKRRIFCHALRSSFATHLLESGTDIRVIQELLGHTNLATTERYTLVSTTQLKKVKSPMDSIAANNSE